MALTRGDHGRLRAPGPGRGPDCPTCGPSADGCRGIAYVL
jgi:hypothetical protein